MAQRHTLRKWLYLVAIVVVASVAVYYFSIRHNKATQQLSPQTSTGQSVSGGGKQPTGSFSGNQGTASDNKGQSPTPVNTSVGQWQTSKSGLVTVQQPASGSTVVTGFTLSGTTSVNGVQYRLIDDKVGVISQGIISVVDGKFSATINFKSYGSTGRLDVFTTDASGKEINEVQLTVSFGV